MPVPQLATSTILKKLFLCVEFQMPWGTLTLVPEGVSNFIGMFWFQSSLGLC